MMKRHTDCWTMLAGLLALLGCVAFMTDRALSAESQSAATESAGSASAADAAGLTIHIDPQTGRIVKSPAGVPLQLPQSVQNAMSTSHQGLVPIPSPRPGGGMMLELQGRFQHPVIGTVDADGKLNVRHLDVPPASAEK